MDSWQARFESFNKRKRVKQGSTTIVLKWPHPTNFLANPETLAEAGFYFTPTLSTPDAVRCFSCGKELSDWEEGDDPFAEHTQRGVNCYWAVARCGLRDDMDEEGNYTFPNSARAPTGKLMEKARLDSYASNWPHGSTRGHSANSKKMAQAGFLFTPQGPDDDTATCFYCGTSLSGWEDGDDPLKEHRKRVEKAQKLCPFFAPQSAPLAKSVGRPPNRSQSKPPSTSAATSKRKAKELQRDEQSDSQSYDEDVAASVALTNPKSRAPTSRRTTSVKEPGSRAKTPSSRKSTRSASVAKQLPSQSNAVAPETEDEADASEAESGKRVSKSKKKGSGKGKGRIAVIEEEGDVAELSGTAVDPPPPPLPKPKRGRPPKNKTAVGAIGQVEAPPDTSEQPASSRTRSRTHTEHTSDAAVASSSEPKSKTSAKKTANVDSVVANEGSQLTARISSSGTRVDQVVAAERVEQGQLEPPVKPQMTSNSTAKAQQALPSPRRTMNQLPGPQPQSGMLLAGQSAPAPNLEPMKSNRKSSSTSDDAGYATAEHDATLQLTSTASDVFRRKGSVKPGRSSSRPASSMVRTSSRLHTEVVDISSSDEEMLSVKSSTNPVEPLSEKLASLPPPEPLRTEQPSAATPNKVVIDKQLTAIKRSENLGASRPPSRSASKDPSSSKFLVNVVPPPSSGKYPTHDDILSDVEMGDAGGPPLNGHSTSKQALTADTDVQPGLTLTPATTPPRTPSLTPTDTELPNPIVTGIKPSAPALPSFDEEMEEENIPTSDDGSASFTPFLSMVPLQKLMLLTEEECEMTLEQYIRAEIEKQYSQFKQDAERKIALFQAKAAETRSIIESA